MAIKFLNSVAVDTDVLFVDTANERVGIGTTSPAVKLDVVGDAQLQSAAPRLVMKETGSSKDFSLKVQTDGRFSVLNDNLASEVLTIKQDGNVGIGTTSPSTKLHVQGGASGYLFRVQGTSTLNVYDPGAAAEIGIGSSSGDKLKLFSNDSLDNGITIDTTGNVGIGTTSPSQKLHVSGNARVTGAYYDSGNTPGTANQVLASTATGTSWIDPGTITAEAATLVVIACKNTSGATITKGTPVYQTGTVGATDVIEVAPADALISSGSQPAIGLLQTTLNDQGFGNVVITGELLNFTTDPIDGVTPTTGDKIFLKSGGGLTLVKPTGAGNAIQNLGLIGKVAIGNAGSITVSSIMRANDVPNLPTGKIWVGDGNTIVSDTVFLDEPNGRLGIGTTSPARRLQVSYSSTTAPGFSIKNINAQAANNVVMAFNRDNSDSLGWTQGIDSGDNSFKISEDGDNLETNPRIVILAGGNVGIGTTSPSSPLHIKFNSTSTTFPTGAGDFLKVENTNTTVDTHSSISLRSGTADSFISTVYKGINIGDLVFNLDNGGVAEKMRILANGNVGIGTDSPSQKLEVDGEVLSDGYRVSAMQTAPAARNSTGTLGEIRITSNYIYVCYATNSWSRVALATSW